MDFTPIAVLPLEEAKKLQDQLFSKGVEVKLEHNEQTCTRGCAVTVEFHAKLSDIDVIRDVFTENQKNLLQGHNVDWEALNAVYDPNKSHALCPACSTEFDTSLKECPECGLVLG